MGSVYHIGGEPTADPRNYLVLINPAGGKGKGVHIYRSQIRPLFELADANCEVIVTGMLLQQNIMECKG